MEMATTLIRYLAQHGVAYDRIPHQHTDSSINSAHATHIPDDVLAKPIILKDREGYLMVVIPASSHLQVHRLNRLLHRNMGLASEADLNHLFTDCEPGAVPPFGQAYGLDTIIDYSLTHCHAVYCEAGNHEELIQVKGSDFRRLMRRQQQAALCMH
jgi:Ala-tRNA(Pro) deacylase